MARPGPHTAHSVEATLWPKEGYQAGEGLDQVAPRAAVTFPGSAAWHPPCTCVWCSRWFPDQAGLCLHQLTLRVPAGLRSVTLRLVSYLSCVLSLFSCLFPNVVFPFYSTCTPSPQDHKEAGAGLAWCRVGGCPGICVGAATHPRGRITKPAETEAGHRKGLLWWQQGPHSPTKRAPSDTQESPPQTQKTPAPAGPAQPRGPGIAVLGAGGSPGHRPQATQSTSHLVTPAVPGQSQGTQSGWQGRCLQEQGQPDTNLPHILVPSCLSLASGSQVTTGGQESGLLCSGHTHPRPSTATTSQYLPPSSGAGK